MKQRHASSLTGMEKRNDGVFLQLKVIQASDGRAVIRGYGNPMQAFGNRYSPEANGGETSSE